MKLFFLSAKATQVKLNVFDVSIHQVLNCIDSSFVVYYFAIKICFEGKSNNSVCPKCFF